MEECPICFDTIHSQERITILSCNHVYHRSCINRWIEVSLKKNTYSCPKCRHEEVYYPIMRRYYKLGNLLYIFSGD